MPTPPSGARFKITNGATVSPSTDGGCDAAIGDSLTFQLEASPALDVRSCKYEVLLPTKGAPSITLSSSGVASPPTAGVTSTMPSGIYSFVVRCQTNGGEPIKVNGRDDYTINTFERVVAVRAPLSGLKKDIIGETLEYDRVFGWVGNQNDLVDVIEDLTVGSITFGAAPPAIAAASGAGVQGSASRSDHTHAHGSQAGGSTHAAAVAGVSAGFISSADQQKLDDATSAATASKLAIRDGSGGAAFIVASAKQFRSAPFTVTFGATITLSTANGALQVLTMTGDATFATPTVTNGDRLVLLVTQDGTGGRSITWDGSDIWFPSASAAADQALTAAPGAVDLFEFAAVNGRLMCLVARKDLAAP